MKKKAINRSKQKRTVVQNCNEYIIQVSWHTVIINLTYSSYTIRRAVGLATSLYQVLLGKAM
jgi:hypothetical protein